MVKSNNRNWNNSDAHPDESEDEYETRKNEESQAFVGLILGIFEVYIFILKMAAILGVFPYVGFLLSQKLLGEESSKFKAWVFSLLFTYFIFCIIYFFKRTSIGLELKNRNYGYYYG